MMVGEVTTFVIRIATYVSRSATGGFDTLHYAM